MTARTLSLRPRLSEFGFGVLYWATFLLALEPGNLMRAADAGQLPAFQTEALRIIGASLLGATSTPLVMSLLRRFPVEGPRLWRHVTLHSAANAVLALGLILLSCILAPMLRIGDSRPVWVALPEHVASNGLLLFFCLGTFMMAVHALKLVTPTSKADDRESNSHPAYPAHLEVRTRGTLTRVNINDIVWIETQGNYQALHTSSGTHLVRVTATQLDARLDPARFVRTHRRSSVAINRISDMRSIGNGDAELRLVDGEVIRVSRSHRENVREAISRQATQTTQQPALGPAVAAAGPTPAP